MLQIEDGVLEKMSSAVDPVIRAAAMLEVVDGVLLCPVPFPRRFFRVTATPKASLQLYANPEQLNENSTLSPNRIDCYPGISFDFCAHGEIPASLVAKAQLPFSTVLLWHRANYVGPLHEDGYEKQDEDDKHEDEAATTPAKVIPNPWGFTPLSASLPANGRFNILVECPTIREEGNYRIEVKLGCRDIRGGDWEIPVDGKSNDPTVGSLEVQVSRSGWNA